MTERPIYFAVIRWHDREQARLFFDEVPRELLRKGSALVYCTRLDTLPHGEQMIIGALYPSAAQSSNGSQSWRGSASKDDRTRRLQG